VLALGLTFVIAAGEIDLSFPSIIAFSGYVLATNDPVSQVVQFYHRADIK
jgi:ribose/xylose/arabinose/galactoside ABC-type transport system permease subunit